MVNDTLFPLFLNDGLPIVRLSFKQMKTLKNLKDEISNDRLVLVENHCLCGNDFPEKDRYELPVSQILCSKCGLIRSKVVFNDISNINFYKNHYRSIYTTEIPSDKFFEEQYRRGRSFLKLVKRKSVIEQIQKVVEVGCGSDEILKPFSEIEKKTAGDDFDKNYLDYGKKSGLDIIVDDANNVSNETIDLIILSHVMEHFLHPIEEMRKIISNVKPQKHLLIEVPGAFWISKSYFNPITYFQNAHVYNYYYLTTYFQQMGLNVLYGDERRTFILQKLDNWNSFLIEKIFDESLTHYVSKIENYLVECQHQFKYQYSNLKWIKSQASYLVGKSGLKMVIDFIFRRNKWQQ